VGSLLLLKNFQPQTVLIIADTNPRSRLLRVGGADECAPHSVFGRQVCGSVSRDSDANLLKPITPGGFVMRFPESKGLLFSASTKLASVAVICLI
jgi:hypothetical protein